MIALTLPIPPSVNGLFLNPPRPHMRRPISPAYMSWRWEALVALKAQTYQPIKGTYKLRLMLPAKMRGDVSNRLKALEDFLVTHGVTSDDRHNAHVSAERSASVPAGECHVQIEAVP